MEPDGAEVCGGAGCGAFSILTELLGTVEFGGRGVSLHNNEVELGTCEGDGGLGEEEGTR